MARTRRTAALAAFGLALAGAGGGLHLAGQPLSAAALAGVLNIARAASAPRAAVAAPSGGAAAGRRGPAPAPSGR